DPQMHDPPAPVLNDRKVRAHSPKKSRTVEQCDSGSRQEVESYQRSWCALFLERRNGSTRNQEEPQQQTNKKRCLPDSAKIYVFVALMSEPKPQTSGQLVHDREPLPGHRPQNNYQQRAKENIYAELLPFRFVTADEG